MTELLSICSIVVDCNKPLRIHISPIN